ncbi:uncharacterized membrane protein (DUF4010 family) [Ulvibacter sp. MAR_2010_11]|uniref:MgtC/SapB family protein n=1 Tax=Ulvibacter sp. MAR_2010_11 TaxID=1250229 RepID=UPI000C2C9242|nr:MgtC/SapB family protein [Ulvibacter sp. MAR_2010_11]PKA83343.1 uncharacterized membrane protein (DUF4010 family) [Ulvibacter sp. MAR_2010_11]
MNYPDLITLGISFGLGMLIGLQREKTDNKIAGVRTFTLIAVLGTISGFLTRDFENPFIFPMMGIALAGFLITANIIKLKKQKEADIGQTTEVAALLMFALGGYLVLGNQVIAIIVGGSMAVLLYVKEHLHDLIDKLKDKDLAAIMTFAGISLVVLPILPDKTYGPLDVLNPQNIWLMVTLIVGISVAGYFIYKFLGKKAGVISNGILGGIISSTATTVSYARKTKDTKNISKLSAFVITASATVSLVRIMIEIGVVLRGKTSEVILPLIVFFIFMVLVCIGLFYLINKEETNDTMPEPKNPAQFKSALFFGLLYGVILLTVAFAEKELGDGGLYTVSVIGGLANKDAITLSLSQLVKGGLDSSFGWRLILVATLSNFAFKVVLSAILGTKQLVKWTAIAFGLSMIAGLLLLWLWPESWQL